VLPQPLDEVAVAVVVARAIVLADEQQDRRLDAVGMVHAAALHEPSELVGDGLLAELLPRLPVVDRPAAQALATGLVRALRPDGALLGFFGSADHTCIGCTKFVVEDESHVRLRPHASTLERHARLQNREIIKMFEGLRVSDSFLLQNGWREMLFRKGGVGRPIT